MPDSSFMKIKVFEEFTVELPPTLVTVALTIWTS